MTTRIFVLAVVTLMTGIVSSTWAGDDTVDALIDLMRSDVRAERIAIITEVMDFTEEEASVFWPVYRRYEKEQRKINDKRLELIKEYGKNYFDMPDATARHIVKTWIELDIKESYMKKKYFRRFEWVMGTIKAAKFLQLENQINLLIRLQIAAELPMLEEWK
ncbi:MAG: hypothetical protein JSW50_15180 [Candidatus Latescibacterota bacterium]|nr:MAG: hypothetical protein JSW50_15180 [Candidatus Latescibacterota bacterium]